MIKIDFRQIGVKNIEGQIEKADVSKQLGNVMYMQGQNIEECELGHTIYKTSKLKPDEDTSVELTDEQVNIVRRFIQPWPYVLRSAIENTLLDD